MRQSLIVVAGTMLWCSCAFAQSITITAPAEHADAVDDFAAPQVPDEPQLDDAALAAALTYDPEFAASLPKKSWHNPKTEAEARAEWTRNGQPDGASSIGVKRKLPIAWDGKVGAELDLPPAPVTTYEPDKPLPGTIKERRAGAAWANVTVPDLATVGLRIAPSDQQRTVGTSVERTVPLGERFAMTMQGGVSVTENYPGVAPVMSATTPGLAPAQVWDQQRKLQFKILPTGTTLAAESSSSTLDNLTHHTLSAEQRIYGPLRVTTSVTDPGQPTASKSIAAGLKLSW